MNNLYKNIKEELNESEEYHYFPEVSEYGPYNSESNTNLMFMLEEIERYFTESYNYVKEVVADSERNYRELQASSEDVEYLRKLAEKAKELNDLNNEFMDTFL